VRNTRADVDYSEKDYREYWVGPTREIIHQAECSIINEVLPPSRGWFVHIGCGFGRLLPAIHNSERKIVLVDYALNHLEMASEKYPDQEIYFVCANACRLPFVGNVFEGGLSIRMLQHIKEPETFLHELNRILIFNSSFLLTYVNRRSLLRTIAKGKVSFHKTHEIIFEDGSWGTVYGTHPAYFNRLIRKNGFTANILRGTGFIHQVINRVPVLEKWFTRNSLFISLSRSTESILDNTLGRTGWAWLQFALLKKVSKFNNSNLSLKENLSNNLLDILMCPSCQNTELVEEESQVLCLRCGKTYQRRGKIYDFRL